MPAPRPALPCTVCCFWTLWKSGQVAQKLGQGGPSVRPVVAEILSQRGLNSGPLPNEKSITREPPHIENASAPAESMENDFDKLIDRFQKSNKSDFDDEIFEQARNLIFE